MDAITLLRTDHSTVEALFKRFEKAGDRAYVEKRAIVDRIVEELSVHAAIEERVFYPATRETVPATEGIALESLEEHHIVKWVLSELEGLDPQHERFDAKVTVLIENVRHHVKEEQDEYFPMVREAMSRTELADLGQKLADAKRSAPTHPHPRAADAPPGNAVMSAIAGIVDRVSDNVSGIAQGGVAAGQELIGRVVGTKRPVSAPSGTTAARGAAKATRATIGAAIDGTSQTLRTASRGTASSVKAASAGAKGTVTSGKKAASATATTAKRAATTTTRTAKDAVKASTKAAKSTASKTAAAARS